MYGQGKTRGQISELMVDAGTNQACASIQLYNKDLEHRKYIKLFFQKAYEELRSLASGGAQPNLNLGKVTNSILPIPPLAEQHRIVKKVDSIITLCDNLKSQLINKKTTQQNLATAFVEKTLAMQYF
jgi:type I restriction enzyme, S subunit